MRHQNVEALAKTGQATALGIEQQERLRRIRLVIDAYNALPDDQIFVAPKDLENRDLAKVAATPTAGNIVQVAVDALNKDGTPTEPMVGSVMRSMGLALDYAHGMFCYCHEPTTCGRKVALRIGVAAAGYLKA